MASIPEHEGDRDYDDYDGSDNGVDPGGYEDLHGGDMRGETPRPHRAAAAAAAASATSGGDGSDNGGHGQGPESAYYTVKVELERDPATGTLGCQFSSQSEPPHQVWVGDIQPGTPAAGGVGGVGEWSNDGGLTHSGGLRRGDILWGINGVDVTGLTLTDVAAHLQAVSVCAGIAPAGGVGFIAPANGMLPALFEPDGHKCVAFCFFFYYFCFIIFVCFVLDFFFVWWYVGIGRRASLC
jgi:hypothetical protein